MSVVRHCLLGFGSTYLETVSVYKRKTLVILYMPVFWQKIDVFMEQVEMNHIMIFQLRNYNNYDNGMCNLL